MGKEDYYSKPCSQMTLKWIIVPFVIGVFIISASIITFFVTSYAEQKTESILIGNMDLMLDHIKDRADVLLRANASSFDVASSLEPRKINSFNDLEKKVAPRLFIALLTTQLAAEVSYIRNDGLLFTYERDNNSKIVVIFSNSTSPCSFYSQTIDQQTGIRNGDAIPLKCNETKQKYLNELNGETVYTSANSETLLFKSAVGNNGTVSIEVDLKDFLRFVSDIGFSEGRLFFTINGSSVNQTLVPLDKNGVLNDNGSGYEHLSSMYKLRKTQIDIAGTSLVFTVAFPYKQIITIYQVIKIILLALVSLTIIFLATLMFIMVKFLRRSQIQETILRANLIKQKEAVQQAERKSMNKSMAFAQASHDVRNQLLNVISLIEKCLEEVAPQSDLEKDLKDMESCADNLQGILKSILDTSKVESGKMHLQVTEFDISKTIEESVNLSNVRAHNKGLEVIWDPCDFSVLKLGKVQGDKIRFKQILDNLLGNAVNYTDEGQIVLRAWAKKPNLNFSSISSDYGFSLSRMFCCSSRRFWRNWQNEINPQKNNSVQNDPFAIELIFEVDDTGIGIPVEKRAAVFENYVQVKEGSLFMNKDNVDKPQGTGLGLGIVQSFVRLMGGEISIRDKDPGTKGTCFRFSVFLRSSGFQDMKDERSEFTSELPVFNEPNMVKGVHSLLFVRGCETKKILTRWMESLGIKVWVAQEFEQISPTLEKIKHNINSSSKSDSVLFCKTFSRNSSNQEREGFLSVGREKVVDMAQRKAFYGGLPLRVLIIVDISGGNLSEIWSSLRDFIANNPYVSCKVACISDLTTSSQAKRKFRSLPNCNLVLDKPVHGSKLQSLFELIQELERIEEGDLKKEMDQSLNGNKDEKQLERMEEGNLKKEMNQPLNGNKDEKQSLKQNEIIPEMKITIEDEKPLSGMAILYAEDDAIARKIGTRKLIGLGATVESAENGLIALNLVKQALKSGVTREEGSYSFTYDVILMDCQMPLMDGYEATREIRKEEKLYDIHVPIIALTGSTGEEEERKTSYAGMDFHMPKPLERNRLLEAIRRSSITN